MSPLISRTLLDPRPQEVGKIKLGGRGKAYSNSGGGTSYRPEKYDHFVVTTRVRENGDGPYLRDEEVHAVVGDKPTELLGWLMFPEIEQNIMTTMAHYQGRKPSVKCDGEVQESAEGVRSPCSRQPDGTGCRCRPYTRLTLQLRASPHTGGYYVFRTRSWETTNNLQTFLEETHGRFGTLHLAPVKLLAYMGEDLYTQDGKDKVGKSMKVAMVLDMSYEDAAVLMAERKEAIESIRGRLMLAAGEVKSDLDESDRSEADEIADEFDPPRGLEASVKTQQRVEEVVANLVPVASESPDEEDCCPETGQPCVHSCEMECYLQDSTSPPEESEPEPAAEGDEAGGTLREKVIRKRDQCRALEVLDSVSEKFIQDALANEDSAKSKQELGIVLRALDRRLANAEGQA